MDSKKDATEDFGSSDCSSSFDRAMLDKILSATIVFWTCPVCVSPEVKWVDGGLWAFCVDCGRKSTDARPETNASAD